MKKIVLSMLFIGLAGISHAVSFNEKPAYTVSTSTTVSISTDTWTVVPADGNTESRTGIQVSNPATNSAAIVGMISTSSSSPTEATTIRPIELEAGENAFIRIGAGIYLYLLSLHTSAENVHLQEYLAR